MPNPPALSLSAPAPAIYVRTQAAPLLAWQGRIISLAIAAGCLGVLIIAALLPPDRHGMGTHRALGLNGCQFLERTNLPCPSCGMTTSFALFMHGRLFASLYVQPFGTLLAAAALITVWLGGYIAVTGRPVHRLLRVIPWERWILPILLLGTAAWAWKIAIHLTGYDGF